MKIVLVSHSSYLQGGAQGCLLDLVKGMRKAYLKSEIYLVFPDEGELIESFRPYINDYIVIEQPWWMIEPNRDSISKSLSRFFRIWRYARKTLDYLNRIKPDIVMTNTIASPVAALACRWGKYKHVWFIHEVPSNSGSYSFLYPESLIVNWIHRVSYKVIVNSEYTLQYYAEKMKSQERLHKVHLGVEVKSHQAFPNKSCYTLLLIGNFNENKGQSEAIEACRLLFNEGVKFRLLLVGSGDDEYSDSIRRLIHDLQLDEYVKMIQHTSDVASYYLQSDVLLMCSASEGFSKVIIEAQRFGLPIIATSIGASKELVDNGFNGFLYQRGDVHRLAMYIKDLADISLRKQMSSNARSFVEGRYSVDQFVSEVFNLFDYKELSS